MKTPCNSVMTLSSAALITAVMFADAAMARTSHSISRHRATNANASIFPIAGGSVGILAPRVGTLPAAPANQKNCDFGDNERIC